MVYFNKKVLINIKKLESIILEKLDKQIENELYYINDIKDEKKENIKNNILKEIGKEMKKDFFIYRIMADDRCTYKHKHGKNEGYFCHNNITKNGDHKKYLCRTHNRNHIPNKKTKYNISNKNISIGNSIKQIKNISIGNSIKQIKDNTNIGLSSEDASSIIDINKTDILIKNDTSKVLSLEVKSLNNIENKHKHVHGLFKYTTKISKKRYTKNTNINILKNILNLYNNIICKSNKNYSFYNFKHKDNKIPIFDFLI